MRMERIGGFGNRRLRHRDREVSGMSATKTVAQLVSECFCPATGRGDYATPTFAYELWNIVRSKKDVEHLAKAARKFVKMENKLKAKGG